jgi:hypothetical protein
LSDSQLATTTKDLLDWSRASAVVLAITNWRQVWLSTPAPIRKRYADLGPTLAADKLRECHGVVLSKETVRSLMMSSGLWILRRQRAPRSISCADAARLRGRVDPVRRMSTGPGRP